MAVPPELACAYFLADSTFAASTLAAASAYFLVKRSTRPAVSMSFCLPVKKGWQFEQISTFNLSPLIVERVVKLYPPRLSCRYGALRLRPQFHDSFDDQRRQVECRNLLELPSLLHWQAEAH